MDDWDRGRWCDVCHQRHYQISPACERRRKQREQLAHLATLAPGWFDRDRHGRWGVPPDEGALTTARRFIEQLGDLIARHPPHCNADPYDGDIHLQWWDSAGGTLSVYIEAGVVGLIIGHDSDPTTPFSPNRDETPFAEALTIVRGWLQED